MGRTARCFTQRTYGPVPKAPRRIQPRPALLPFPYERPAPGSFSGLDQNRLVARGGLIAARNHVDVERVELDPATDAAGSLGGDEGRAGAEEWVDDDVAAIGEVEERVLEHGGGLDGRMVFESSAGVGAKRRGARVGPEVRAHRD